MNYDVAVIGAGIIGLSTAYQLIRANPDLKVIIIEKENDIAKHQTGNNSGVIHSGIYYKPGSLKAENCKAGYRKLIDFCEENTVPYDICGKIIVASNKDELIALDSIFERGKANGLVGIRKIDADEIKDHEPYCAGVKGVFVPQTGIINYKSVANKMLELFLALGGKIVYSYRVTSILQRSKSVEICSKETMIETRFAVNCAGLYSDKLVRTVKDLQIIPFRGEFYRLKKEKEYLVKNLIYPVPNPNFPFLGVHFTRTLEDGVEAGPNAVLAFAREGYTKSDININELIETLRFRGFHNVARRHWREALKELGKSYSKRRFVTALQALIPTIEQDDVLPAKAGVRAQACDKKGNLIDDFLLIEEEKILHVCNSPSPAATASLSIGEFIVKTIRSRI